MQGSKCGWNRSFMESNPRLSLRKAEGFFVPTDLDLKRGSEDVRVLNLGDK